MQNYLALQKLVSERSGLAVTTSRRRLYARCVCTILALLLVAQTYITTAHLSLDAADMNSVVKMQYVNM